MSKQIVKVGQETVHIHLVVLGRRPSRMFSDSYARSYAVENQ